MEKTFTISVKGISTNVIISQWCHVMMLRKLNEQITADPETAMDYTKENAACLVVYYAYCDYCGRNQLPTIFNYDDIKKTIYAAAEGSEQMMVLKEIGAFYSQIEEKFSV